MCVGLLAGSIRWHSCGTRHCGLELDSYQIHGRNMGLEVRDVGGWFVMSAGGMV